MNVDTMTRLGALALLSILTVARPASAQQTKDILITDLPMVEQIRIETEQRAADTEAATLLDQARSAERAGDWKKAARLYQQSGDLRTDGDQLAAQVFALAGRAYHFSDNEKRASAMWEEAGSRSLIHGDVAGAARNFMYAAVVAQEAGNRTRAVELGWKAYHLTRSPLLNRAEKDEIRGHLQLKPTA